jgi:hypothetical protein
VTPRSVSVERIARTTIFLTVALAALCFVARAGEPISVLAGGAVSVVNLRLIRLLVSRLMSPAATGPRMSSVVTAKFLVLLALLAIALKRLPIDAASFLLGGGTLFIAILLDAVLLGEPVQASREDAGNS